MLNYNSPKEIRAALDTLGVRLQKRWGQNFLVNRGAREEIVSLLDPGSGDTVWEIGPGLGTLTVLLLPRVRLLFAFEIDRGLIRFLRDSFADRGSFRLVDGDVLKTWKFCYREHGLPDKIVGNLPYGSASALIGSLAEHRIAAGRLVFTVQRELAERMTAAAGTKSYSSFSVLCQLVYSISRRMQLKPGSFFPPPEVHSAVLVLEPKSEVMAIPQWDAVLRCLRLLFRSRRKTMRNNLLAAGIAAPSKVQRLDRIFDRLGIDPRSRGERLSPPDLLRLSRALVPLLQDL